MRRILLFAVLLSAGCYDRHEAPPVKRQEAAVNTTLPELRRLYAGTPFEVASDIAVAGYVVSSDAARNFYGTIVIEDAGAAAEIMAGTDHLFNRYPVGSRLVVRLQGLTVAENYGVLQIGRKPAPGSGYPTDYLDSQAALDKSVIRTGEKIDPQPEDVRLDALSAAYCGRLIRLENLIHVPEGLDHATWSGYRRFIAADTEAGEADRAPAIYVHTRSYADWAEEQVPLQPLTLTGILQYGRIGGSAPRYILKPNDIR